MTYQTVDGFGAGIKRRTEHLFALEDNMREQIETYAFQDLEPDMIRFSCIMIWKIQMITILLI